MSPPERDILTRFSRDRVGAPIRRCNATVALVSLEFVTDHGLLTDKFTASIGKTTELDRYTPGGQKFQDQDPKEWRRAPAHNFPISHTKDKKIELIAEFEIGPLGVAPGPAFVDIDGGTTWTRFTTTTRFVATNAARTNTVKVNLWADETVPDHIQKAVKPFTWKVDFCGQRFEGVTGPHTIYITYDLPTPEDDQPNGTTYTPEPLGVTLKRMDASVGLVEPMDAPVVPPLVIQSSPPKTLPPSREHFIVWGIMRKFPFYQLHDDASLAAFKHSGYFNRPTGGAWPMADFVAESGQCQAIARFTRDVLKELGVPGTTQVVYVYAKPQTPYTAEESDVPVGYTWHGAAGNQRLETLTDTLLTTADIGKRYPQPHTPMPDGTTSVGFNNYEACIKYSHGGLTLYFPGGTSGMIWENADQVLKHSFYNFVEVASAWYPSDNDPNKTLGYQLTKILATY